MGGVVELGSAPSCKDGRGKAIGGGVLGPLPYGQSVCPLILSLVPPPPLGHALQLSLAPLLSQCELLEVSVPLAKEGRRRPMVGSLTVRDGERKGQENRHRRTPAGKSPRVKEKKVEERIERQDML